MRHSHKAGKIKEATWWAPHIYSTTYHFLSLVQSRPSSACKCRPVNWWQISAGRNLCDRKNICLLFSIENVAFSTLINDLMNVVCRRHRHRHRSFTVDLNRTMHANVFIVTMLLCVDELIWNANTRHSCRLLCLWSTAYLLMLTTKGDSHVFVHVCALCVHWTRSVWCAPCTVHRAYNNI